MIVIAALAIVPCGCIMTRNRRLKPGAVID
jgi:hypothetical protein